MGVPELGGRAAALDLVSEPHDRGARGARHVDREAIAYDYQFPDGALIDVCPDGRGGVFVLLADPLYTGMEPSVLPRLLRLQGDAAPALDWPAGGTWFTATREPWDLHVDRRVRVLPDGNDGAITGHSRLVSHGIDYRFHRFDAAGAATLEIWGGEPEGLEVVRKGSSGLIVADYDPSGPNGQYDGPAHLTVRESSPPAPSTVWWEAYEESGWLRYGDIGLAESGDGGAVLFWSQSRERFGLFARRFGPPGPTTDVAPATTASLDLVALRFVAGRGLVAAVSLPEGVAGRLELFDLSGRRVSSVELAAGAPGSREIELRSDPPRGVYFVRLTAGGTSVGRKVVRVDP